MDNVFNKVCIIGLGLIGGSIGLSMKRSNTCNQIIGYAKTKSTLERALDRGLVDKVEDNLKDAVKDADLVILCVPVGAMEQVMLKIAPFLKTGATISDVGSVKRAVINAVEPHLPTDVKFVPAHPLAGTQRKVGVGNSLHRWFPMGVGAWIRLHL